MYRNRAFTLIELLVVIAIIGILAALIAVQLRDKTTLARNAGAKSDIVQMGKAIEAYRALNSNNVFDAVATTGDTLVGSTDTNRFAGELFSTTFKYYGFGLTHTQNNTYTYTYSTEHTLQELNGTTNCPTDPATTCHSVTAIGAYVISSTLNQVNPNDPVAYYVASGAADTVAAGGSIPSPSGGGTSGQTTLLDRKMVWAHNIPSGSLTYSGIDAFPNTYGANYPLVLANQTSAQGTTRVIKEAEAAGIDGFAVDILNQGYINGALSGYLTAADPDAPKVYIAPTLDVAGLGNQTNVTNALTSYCNATNGVGLNHPSAAMIGSKWLIFLYGSNGLTPTQWQQVRDSANAVGCDTYFVGDVGVNFNGCPGSTTITNSLSANFPSYDTGYIFGSAPFSSNYFVNGAPYCSSTTAWETILSYFQVNSKPYIGGVWPGYYRGYNTGNPFGVDQLATSLYSREWDRQINASLPWAHITTWNDFTEHTVIEPSSDQNVTMSDLTAWYVSTFKNQGPPFSDARLYITTPQSLWINQDAPAEALVINPTASSVTASIQLIDNTGALIGNSAQVTVAAKSIGRATLSMLQGAVPVGHFLRARATLGATVVTSAPVLYYPTTRPAGIDAPVLYYSIPATAALSNSPGLTVSGGTATVTLPAGTTTYSGIDVLHNTKMVGWLMGGKVKSYPPASGPFSAMLSNQPADGYFHSDDAYTLSSDYGLFVARVIDSQGKVSYSDPVYIGP